MKKPLESCNSKGLLVHHQGFEQRGEGQKTLRNGGLSALPALTYPRNYPSVTSEADRDYP